MATPVMYIIANKGLGMSAGKLAAQVAHAAVKAYEISNRHWNDPTRVDKLPGENPVKAWNESGYAKVVLEARDTEHLLAAQKYIEEKGFKTFLIVDEGRTEIDPHSPTALGVEIVDKADRMVSATFGDFKTYRDQVRVTVDIDR